MEQDLTVLQNISDALKENPSASQRQLAKRANMSLGMMNAILGRLAERGWIMLSNVNARKFAYAVTPEGFAELRERSINFTKRTFAIANEYDEVLYNVISKAKTDGKKKVILYGESYIKFLLVYSCKEVGIDFEKHEINSEIDFTSLCLIGELVNIEEQKKLIKAGCLSLVELVNREIK